MQVFDFEIWHISHCIKCRLLLTFKFKYSVPLYAVVACLICSQTAVGNVTQWIPAIFAVKRFAVYVIWADLQDLILIHCYLLNHSCSKGEIANYTWTNTHDENQHCKNPIIRMRYNIVGWQGRIFYHFDMMRYQGTIRFKTFLCNREEKNVLN